MPRPQKARACNDGGVRRQTIFHLATNDQIRKGEVADIYFERVVDTLKKAKIDKRVVAEVRVSSLPENWPWAIFSGLEEVKELFAGHDVDIVSLPEGSVFYEGEPVLSISGRYQSFGILETALLGLLCQASGVATKAARCKLAAGERQVYSFGARRMHPGIAPMIERNAYIGGCDGVSTVVGGLLIGKKPVGTMSHSLMLVVGSDEEAFKIFDKAVPPEVPRIALIDTFSDEKFGALKAADIMGEKLFGVRLDTPRSRRGDFNKILQEVRWELDIRGFTRVKLMVSGGLDENSIEDHKVYADAFGVGTSISNAPVVDYSLDIVEVEGKALAKRGKKSGRKQISYCVACNGRMPIRSNVKTCPKCGGELEHLLLSQIKNGKRIGATEPADKIRIRVLDQLRGLVLNEQ